MNLLIIPAIGLILLLNSYIFFHVLDSTLRVVGSVGWFYGISTIVGYLMPNSFYIYILNIYDLVWLGFMAYQLM